MTVLVVGKLILMDLILTSKFVKEFATHNNSILHETMCGVGGWVDVFRALKCHSIGHTTLGL